MRIGLLLACVLPLTAQTISFLPPNAVMTGGGVVSPCSGCVVTADFNGDGKADLAAVLLSQEPVGLVSLGNGDGTFRPGLMLATSPGAALQVGDFNGDGKPDLISVSQIYLGKGDGTFAKPLAQSETSNSPSVVGAGFVVLTAVAGARLLRPR